MITCITTIQDARNVVLSSGGRAQSRIHGAQLLHLGAEVNVKFRERTSSGDESRSGLTRLHVAAQQGHLAIVKLFLEVGADPEARFQETFTPLYSALIALYGKVARTVPRRVSNLPACLMDSKKQLTPLHLSCYLGLQKCAKFFLSEGVIVDAMDAKSTMSLRYSLL